MVICFRFREMYEHVKMKARLTNLINKDKFLASALISSK